VRLNQVTIGSTELERSERFYTALGLRLIVRTDHYLRFELPLGGSTLSLDLVSAPPEREQVTVYLETDDVDGEYRRLVAAGVTFDQPPEDMPWLWREARLRDPDGHALCLYYAGRNRRFPPWRLATVPPPSASPEGDDVPPGPAPIEVTPIATVVGGRADAVDDLWGGVEATIVLDERFAPDALAGLEEFSHLDVVYVFHGVAEADVVSGARHPRGRPDWPRVGIFAQRAKARPNRIGVSTCRLLRVDGRALHVLDLDAIAGTPVLDIKPHLEEMGPRTTVVEPAWARELMARYWE
jgi:tRNA-Thr(GGU) m(6)t(6)A37 methyltransferase TsaA